MKYAIQQFVFRAGDSDCVSIAPYAQITITDSASGLAASIWSDVNGVEPLDSNVVLADDKGFFRVYVTAGRYNLSILSDSITADLQNVIVGPQDELTDVPVTSVNSRTGATEVVEAIIENFQGFIGTDCLEDPTKSPCSIVTANATLSVRPNGNGMADAIGVWRWVGTGAADIACGALFSGGSGALFTLTAEPVVLIASFSKTSSISKERVVVGAYTTNLNGDTSFGGDVNNGFCISLEDDVGSGQWNFRTTAGGVTTNTGTISSPFADDTRYTCVIVATSTSIKYYVNGILKATHTTNIPAGGLHAGVGMYQVSGGAFQGGTFFLDLLRFGRVYKTTPRNLGIPSVTY